MYEKIKQASLRFLELLGEPEVAIITGTGIDIKIDGELIRSVPYSSIPHMPTPSTNPIRVF